MVKRKTAKDKAQEELDLAKRIQQKAEARNKKAHEDLEAYNKRAEKTAAAKQAEATAAKTAKDEADQRVKFLSTHPALNDGDDGLL